MDALADNSPDEIGARGGGSKSGFAGLEGATRAPIMDALTAIKNQWDTTPCGSSGNVPLTKEYFEEVARYRYKTHPFIKKAIEGFDIRDKEVLEIGFGMGTDHLELARRGARLHGIDLTPRHLEITQARLGLFGHASKLQTGNMEKLPYRDSAFDFIYSLGVLHHTPDQARAVAEIRRVLKPGGSCWIGVYHRNSLFYWWSTVAVNFIMKGRFMYESLARTRSRIEYPGAASDLQVHVHSRSSMTELFARSGFHTIKTGVDHLRPEDVALFSRFLKPRLTYRLASRCGWYLILEATK